MKSWGYRVKELIAGLSPTRVAGGSSMLVAGCSSMLVAGCSPGLGAISSPSAPRGRFGVAAPVVADAAKADPAGAGPGLTAFRPLLAAASVPVALGSERLVASGKGLLAYGSLVPEGQGFPECLVPGGERSRCQFVRVAPWAQPVVGRSYLGPVAGGRVGSWSAVRPAPGVWSSLSPGQDVVYAVQAVRGIVIDAIDEQGKISSLFAAPDYPVNLDGSRLVELPRGLMLVGRDPEDNGLTLVPVVREEGKLAARAPVKTGVMLLPVGTTAEGARAVTAPTRMLGHGGLAVAMVLDTRGEPDGSFYLAWTEVFAPARRTTSGEPAPEQSASGAGAQRRGRHGCGGRPSRELSDASVEKRVHVTRFDADGRRLDDRIAPGVTLAGDDPSGWLTLESSAAGFVLNGVPRGRDGGVRRDDAGGRAVERIRGSTPLAMPLQRLDAAAYDQRRGEGLALLTEAGHRLAVRFDATGDPVGEPVALDARVSVSGDLTRSRLAVAGTAWGALTADLTTVEILTGPAAGKAVRPPGDPGEAFKDGLAWVLPLDDESIEVVRYLEVPRPLRVSLGFGEDEEPGPVPLFSLVNLHRAEATPWQVIPGWRQGGKARLDRLLWVGREDAGRALFVGVKGSSRPELHLLAAGGWVQPVRLEGDGAEAQPDAVFSVWRDHVALLGRRPGTMNWLGRGASQEVGGLPQGEGSRNAGPLLNPGDSVLRAEPVAPLPLDDESLLAYRACPASFATGPRRVVLVCLGMAEPGAPGARLGSRVLRF